MISNVFQSDSRELTSGSKNKKAIKKNNTAITPLTSIVVNLTTSDRVHRPTLLRPTTTAIPLNAVSAADTSAKVNKIRAQDLQRAGSAT
jgi:hypothetical protein